jgi:hypothetical protein
MRVFQCFSDAVALYWEILDVVIESRMNAKKEKCSIACYRLQILATCFKFPQSIRLRLFVVRSVASIKCTKKSKCHEVGELLGDLCILLEACNSVLRLLFCPTIKEVTNKKAKSEVSSKALQFANYF